MQSKIMYIEHKTNGLRGEGRKGRVSFSKTGKTLYYGDKRLVQTKGRPLKANYYDENSLEDFWISSPRKDGQDSLFAAEIKIDEDVREEYWQVIRNLSKFTSKQSYKSSGKSKGKMSDTTSSCEFQRLCSFSPMSPR